MAARKGPSTAGLLLGPAASRSDEAAKARVRHQRDSPPEAARKPAKGPLQPWMRGTIAVAVFLVLAFVAFVINRIWCQNKLDSSERRNVGVNKEEAVISNGTEGRYSTTASHFRYEEGPHVYENEVELECESTAAHHVENNLEVLTTCM